MINHDHKFIFIHIPRTSGTSIENQFECHKKQVKNKHWVLNDWKKRLEAKIFDEYFKFSFIRSPWDAIISKYLDVWFTNKHPGGPIGKKAGKSLEYFLEHYRAPKHEHGETFFDFFDPEQLDFVGRFENRENDLNYISQRIGFQIDPNTHAKKQQQLYSKKHYAEYYSDETREIVAQKYANDIEYFGYKFEKQA